jgi:hypothetical protein
MSKKPLWSWFSIFFLGLLLTESQMDSNLALCRGERSPASSCDAWQSELYTMGEGDEVGSLYDELKLQFETSDHCAPSKIFNRPSDRLSPMLFHRATRGLSFITRSDDPTFTKDLRLRYFQAFAEDYSLSDEATQYGLKLIREQNEIAFQRYEVLQRLRGIVIKDLIKTSESQPQTWDEMLRADLVTQKIFSENEEGEAICPFVSGEVFRKAMAGRAKAVSQGLVPKTDLLTIVDYTRPSNERRMYVIDLKKKQVLHNTWCAHGGGPSDQTRQKEEAGSDGFGSSPTMSNKPTMSYSSDGFYLATGATNHWNNTYGPNVILKGLDVNNTNLTSRAVVLHGWRTPYHEYVSGPWVWDSLKKKRLKPEDLYPKFMSVDFKSASVDDMEEALEKLSAASAPKSKRVETTNGCLGVPQREVEPLMKILPGTLMFNYSGPGMSSKFLN